VKGFLKQQTLPHNSNQWTIIYRFWCWGVKGQEKTKHMCCMQTISFDASNGFMKPEQQMWQFQMTLDGLYTAPFHNQTRLGKPQL